MARMKEYYNQFDEFEAAVNGVDTDNAYVADDAYSDNSSPAKQQLPAELKKLFYGAAPQSFQEANNNIFKIFEVSAFKGRLMRVARVECFNHDADPHYSRAQDWCDEALTMALDKITGKSGVDELAVEDIQANYRIATAFLFALTRKNPRDCQRVREQVYDLHETRIDASEGDDGAVISRKNGKNKLVRRRYFQHDSMESIIEEEPADSDDKDLHALPAQLITSSKEDLMIHRADLTNMIECGVLAKADVEFIAGVTDHNINLEGKNSTAKIEAIKAKVAAHQANLAAKSAVKAATANKISKPLVQADLFEAASVPVVEQPKAKTESIALPQAKVIDIKEAAIKRAAVKEAQARLAASQMSLFDMFDVSVSSVSGASAGAPPGVPLTSTSIPIDSYRRHIVSGRGDPVVYYDVGSHSRRGSSPRQLMERGRRYA